MSEPQNHWNFGWPVAISIVVGVGGVLALAAMDKLPTELGFIKWANPSPSLPPSAIANNPTTSSQVVGSTAPIPRESPNGCGEQLLSKLGRYEGTSVITNSLAKRSGKIVIDISRETNASCRLIARVEEFDPLAGKGTLNGQFDPNVGQKVDLTGSLSHQTEPKVWDVEMNIQFVDKNSIEGQATWKPKGGIEDTKTYYEEFTVTKSF